MKKYILDLKVKEATRIGERYALLKCVNPNGKLPEMRPGQFAELRVDGSGETFLRRPISIHHVNDEAGEVWFMIQEVGAGSRALAALKAGDVLNAVLPLGNGFTLPANREERILLVGGGVGIAPLLYMGACMRRMGAKPTFLLGARKAADLFELETYQAEGRVFVTTEDGSMGEQGFVTQHSLWQTESFDRICVCGPKPMMIAVARLAKSAGIPCEVSLENMMACGVGACLCCVEDTAEGHVCVCKEGPVFDIEKLKWQI